MTLNGATYGASLLRSIAIDLVTAEMDEPYPTVTLGDIAHLDPELVIVPSEPYEFSDDHVAELATALAGARVVRVDGEDLFWWGVRTVAARRRLRSSIGPGSNGGGSIDGRPSGQPEGGAEAVDRVDVEGRP
jgi:hypothetical protein